MGEGREWEMGGREGSGSIEVGESLRGLIKVGGKGRGRK